MTAVAVRSAAAAFSNIVQAARVPARSGLVGEYYFGGSLGKSLNNYADSTKPLAVVGSPTYSSAYASLDRSNGFDTGLLETQDMSLVVIGQLEIPFTYVGTFGDSPHNGNGMSTLGWYSGSFVIGQVASGASGGTLAKSTNLNIPAYGNGWSMLALRTSGQATVTASLDAYQQGQATYHIGIAGTNRDLTSPNTIRIGTNRWTGTQTTVAAGIAAVLIYNRALSGPELDGLYAAQQVWHATRGLPAF